MGEGAQISHMPKSGFGFYFPFLHRAQREEKKEREAFEKYLLFYSRSHSPRP